MPNPKFDQHIQQQIRTGREHQSQARHGVVMKYDKMNNTATVVLSAPDSDEIGDILTNVMCPIYPGIQMAAPEPGRLCWLVFKGKEGEKMPTITHFFNHNYLRFEHKRHNQNYTTLPRFYTAM